MQNGDELNVIVTGAFSFYDCFEYLGNVKDQSRCSCEWVWIQLLKKGLSLWAWAWEPRSFHPWLHCGQQFSDKQIVCVIPKYLALTCTSQICFLSSYLLRQISCTSIFFVYSVGDNIDKHHARDKLGTPSATLQDHLLTSFRFVMGSFTFHNACRNRAIGSWSTKVIILSKGPTSSLYPFSFWKVQLSAVAVYRVGSIWTDLFCFPG